MTVCSETYLEEMLAIPPDQRYVYAVQDYVVKDGDTIDLYLVLWHDLVLHQSCRVIGVDTPECSTPAGAAVKEVVRMWCARAGGIYARPHKRDKFAGRFCGDILTSEGHSLCDFLLDKKLGREYMGERKMEWVVTDLERVTRRAGNLMTGKAWKP